MDSDLTKTTKARRTKEERKKINDQKYKSFKNKLPAKDELSDNIDDDSFAKVEEEVYNETKPEDPSEEYALKYPPQ